MRSMTLQFLPIYSKICSIYPGSDVLSSPPFRVLAHPLPVFLLLYPPTLPFLLTNDPLLFSHAENQYKCIVKYLC